MGKRKAPLTEKQVETWIVRFHRQEGRYPTAQERKSVPGHLDEKWGSLNHALMHGCRRLPGGNSLAQIRNRLVGLHNQVKIIPTGTISVEPERKIPMVTESQRALIHQLQPIEQDMLTRYLEGETQAEIASTYNCTQAAVSYRLVSAARRLQYMDQTGVMSNREFERSLRAAGIDDEHRSVLTALRLYTSQSQTGEKLGTSAGRVRHTLLSAVASVAQLTRFSQKFSSLARQLELMRDNPAILVIGRPGSGRHKIVLTKSQKAALKRRLAKNLPRVTISR